MSGTNVLYFTTSDADGLYPTALWETDGTSGGTHLIASYPSGVVIQPLEVVNGDLLYGVGTSTGIELFLNQGTVAGTQLLLSYDSGPLNEGTLSDYLTFLSPTDLLLETTSPNAPPIYDDADSSVVLSDSSQYSGWGFIPLLVTEFVVKQGKSLYPSDINGLSIFAAFSQGYLQIHSGSSEPLALSTTSQSSAENFLFVATPGTGSEDLYTSAFPTIDPVLVATGASFSDLTFESNTAYGGRLFLAESTGTTSATSHAELLAVAPTDTAPTVVEDFGAGTSIASITNAANTLFVVVTNADGTNSLWVDDGSNNPPTLVGNLGTTMPSQIVAADDGSARIYFQLGDEVAIASAGTITALQTFAQVGTLFANDGSLYFGAAQAGQNIELWTSDGTAAGTGLAATINPSGDADLTNFGTLAGDVFFSADDGTDGTQLWEWNGTTASMVTDLASGSGGINPNFLLSGTISAAAPAGLGQVTFSALDPIGTTSYGSSDGTAADTSVITGTTVRPGVYSITEGDGTVTISHGTANTTITVRIAPAGTEFYGSAPLSFTPSGAFFSYQTLNTTNFDVSSTIGFIGETSLTPVTLASFAPTVSEGTTTIVDQVVSGTTEYFSVETGDGDYNYRITQLWKSDGTQADTVMVATLGSVYDPGTYSSYTSSNNAVVDSHAWGALLAADTGGSVSLFISTGAAGNFTDVTLASIGVSGTIDNTGQNSLGLLGSTFMFSVANDGSVEAVATNGTAAGTTILATSSAAFGDFTQSGDDVYFDDGLGGALYVTDGTAADTKELLSTGADIAPYATVANGANVETPSTASITVAGITYFYFVATEGGQTGLYYADGTTVQTVLASGLAQNAEITASGDTIFFAADDGTGVTTLWTTSAGTTTASMVISPTTYTADSLQAEYFGEPQDVSAIQAGSVYPLAPDTFFLTTGTDTVAGGAGDTAIYASPGDLTQGDQIDGGGGINDLYLSGTGAFDLSAPATLNNITQVLVSATNSTITLRNGTSLLVDLNRGAALGDTIFGATNTDTIAGSSNDTITAGAGETISAFGRVIVTAATDADTISNSTVLEVAGGGTVTLGASISGISTVVVDVPTNLTVDTSGIPFIEGSSGADTITFDNSAGTNSPNFYPNFYYAKGDGGADQFIINDGAAVSVEFYDTAADLNGTTIEGFNFTPQTATFLAGWADFIDITDFAYSAAETAVYNNGTLTVTNAAGNEQTSIAIPGEPSGGGFLLSADSGSGTLVRYVTQLFNLTTGSDTVAATATNQIDAVTDTLTSGDNINGGATGAYGAPESTLQLIGAGTFDLAAPETLTDITTIQGDTTGSAFGASNAVAQTITLRAGLNTPVVLGSGHDTVYGAANSVTITNSPENLTGGGDTIHVGSSGEFVELFGVAADVIHVTAATALATVTDSFEGGFEATGTEDVDGGWIVALGNASVSEVLLTAPTQLYAVNTAPDDLIGSAGHDLLDLTNAGAGSFGGSITVAPMGGDDEILAPINDGLLVTGTQSQLNDTTIVNFNFLPAAVSNFGLTTPDTIDITDLPDSASVTTNFSAGTLTVLNNGVPVDTFYLSAAPSSGGFTATADYARTGTLLSFSPATNGTVVSTTLSASQTSFAASPGNDTLSVPSGAFTASQSLDGLGGVNTLSLTSVGTYDLSVPAVLADFQVLDVVSGATVRLRAGEPMDIFAGGATIIGANATDVIALDGGNGNTVVLGNAGATVVDGGTGTTYSVTGATIGATIEGPRNDTGTLAVTGGGGVVMGNNIQGIDTVDLTETGAVFYANAIPGLAMSLTNGAGDTPDIVTAGSGGDTITDTSTGGNELVAGTGSDMFIFGSGIAPVGDTLYNFDASGADTIEIPNIFTSSVSFANGTLTVGTANSGELRLLLDGTYTGQFTANPTEKLATGTVVTFSGTVTPAQAPCFAAGTRIATSRGEVPVENLREGDLIPTLIEGDTAPVVWIGRRQVDCRAHPRPKQVWPIRIETGAFGPNTPRRDLFVSPDHALFVDGVLIPAKYLINGTSIVQVRRDEVVYFHVRLSRHDVLLADGMPAESYLDVDRHAGFDNRGTLRPLFPPLAWETGGCAELVATGPRLERVRRQLAIRSPCDHAA